MRMVSARYSRYLWSNWAICHFFCDIFAMFSRCFSVLVEYVKSRKRQYEEMITETSSDDIMDDCFTVDQSVNIVPSDPVVLTRSKSILGENTKGQTKKFPTVNTRSGYRTMNEDLMRCATQCLVE